MSRKAPQARARARGEKRRDATPPESPVETQTNIRFIAGVLFIVLVVIYLGNLRLHAAGDSFATRVLPFSVLREGNFDLDEFTWDRTRKGRFPYYLRRVKGHIYSNAPIATALVVTPLYVVPAWLLSTYAIPYDDVRARLVIVAMERVSAATVTALSATILFQILCRFVVLGWALGLTLIYALGTSTWAISSQALWSHGVSELMLTILCAVFLAREPSRWTIMLAGLAAAVAVAARPPMVGFALVALAFVLIYHRRHLIAFVAIPAVCAGLLLAHNLAFFRRVAGGYGGFDHFSTPLLEGIAGLLISPNRGLFIFTPIMLFAVGGAVQVWRTEVRPWLRFLVVGVVLHLLLYAKFDEWWAGYTYGPRYMIDVLPALTLLLVYGVVPLWRSRAVRVLAVTFALYGVAVQAIGVYCADDSWNREPVPLERSPQRVWDWSDLQIVRALQNGWRGGELASVLFDTLRDPVPIRLAALSVDDLASELEVFDPPTRLSPEGAGTAVVRITNRGTRPWPAFSGDGQISVRYLTFLVVRWFVDGVQVEEVGDVHLLPEHLVPGETVEMEVRVVAPSRSASYEVEFRITQALHGRGGIGSRDALRVPVVVE